MLAKLPLRIEIILLLAIKLLILFFIWKLCFSHPLDKSLVPADIETHVFTPVSLTQKAHHDQS